MTFCPDNAPVRAGELADESDGVTLEVGEGALEFCWWSQAVEKVEELWQGPVKVFQV